MAHTRQRIRRGKDTESAVRSEDQQANLVAERAVLVEKVLAMGFPVCHSIRRRRNARVNRVLRSHEGSRRFRSEYPLAVDGTIPE